MQRIRSLYLLLVFSLLLASCQTGAITTNLEAPVLSYVMNELASEAPIENTSVQPLSGTQLAESECLNCHTDKDRLIETADPIAAPTESESSGVG